MGRRFFCYLTTLRHLLLKITHQTWSIAGRRRDSSSCWHETCRTFAQSVHWTSAHTDQLSVLHLGWLFFYFYFIVIFLLSLDMKWYKASDEMITHHRHCRRLKSTNLYVSTCIWNPPLFFPLSNYFFRHEVKYLIDSVDGFVDTFFSNLTKHDAYFIN